MEAKEIIVKQVTEGMKQDSIEVNKNSKGYTYSIKRYGDFSDREEREKIIKDVEELIGRLNKKYGGEE